MLTKVFHGKTLGFSGVTNNICTSLRGQAARFLKFNSELLRIQCRSNWGASLGR